MTRPTQSAINKGSGHIVALTCAYCAASFSEYRSQSQRFKRHFCSRKCSASYASGENNRRWSGGGVEKSCQHCGRQFHISMFASKRGRGRFCSKLCWHTEWANHNVKRERIRLGNSRRYKRVAERRLAAGCHTEFEWQTVLSRVQGRCVGCRSNDRITKDHIIPLARGGSDLIENIQPLCNTCNGKKSMNFKALALDLGTANIGYAISDEKLVPLLGTYHPPGTKKNIGWLCVDFRAWLTPLLKAHGITHIVFESPILNASNNPWTIRKMFSLCAAVEIIAYDANIPVEEALPQSVRKHFLGRGMTPKRRDEIKRAVISRCQQIGWRPANDDEADAAALVHYAICTKTSRILGAQGSLV